jgi:Tfp pilus assembly protein PilN
VRPVNLIPLDQRRGSARTAGEPRSGVRAYILLGALGAALLCVLALVLTTNKINSRTDELATVQAQEQGVKQVADALRPYGQFADLQQSRESQIAGIVGARFDWERSLRQLSRVIPSNVWILNLSATLSPKVEVESAGSGGDIANMREKTDAPAFTITGCTYSHHAVARMMVRMQNLDDVTQVRLAKSARRDDAETGGGAAVAATQSDQQAAQQDVQDCVGSARVTKFDILVTFGGASGAAATTAGAGVPSGAAAPLGQAQAAATQGQAASNAAASTTAAPGGTP